MGKKSRRGRPKAALPCPSGTKSNGGIMAADIASSSPAEAAVPTGTSVLSDGALPATSPSPAAAALTTHSKIPSGASCWICLEEGPDEKGLPLVRDCSCRGDSGFGHFSCIVQYAQRKSKEWVEGEGRIVSKSYGEPWDECPNCNQKYQNELRQTLAEELVSFTKMVYRASPSLERLGITSDPPVLYLEALCSKLCAYQSSSAFAKGHSLAVTHQERKKAALEMLAEVGKLKTQSKFIFGPSSSCTQEVISQYEAIAYYYLGGCLVEEHMLCRNDDLAKSGIKYLEKCCNLYKSLGDEVCAGQVKMLTH